ncbi:hypothetical protein AgCh_023913 [Apium graveolens]
MNIDLNLPVDYDETIPEGGDNIFQEEYTSHTHERTNESTQSTPKNARSYIFDLNQSPRFDLNEPPPSEHPSPPHTQGDENESGTMVRSKTKNLSNDDRRAIYIALLKKSVNGKLKWGTTKAVANEFSVTMRTVQRIWKRAKETSNGVVNVSHLKIKNCGRKRVQIDLQQLKSIPLSKLTTLRSTAYAIKVAKSTLFRCLKRGGKIRRHSNSIKPFLIDKNKRSRVEFCLSMLDKNSFPNSPQFVNMENIIHIDKKWFYLTKKSENYYLVVDEEEPHRTCKS